MTNDHDSEVPPALQHAIETAEDGETGLWLDRHPPTDWHDCPACGTRLYGQSLFCNGSNDLIAVTYSCHHEQCLARWVWETATDELHYRGEAETGAMVGEMGWDE